MSMMLCKICDALIDTDAHPEAFYEVYSYAAAAQPSKPQPPADYECLCDSCAEYHVDEDGYFHPKGIEQGRIPSINHLTQGRVK